MLQNNTENPPAYNAAETREVNGMPLGDFKKDNTTTSNDATSQQVQPAPLMSSSSPFASSSAQNQYGGVTVYTYKNPHTQEVIHSLLPPTHPEIICLQAGEHDLKSSYGLLGWIVGIAWFPLGVALCMLDRKVRCKRCGKLVRDSWSGEVCS